MPKTYNTPKRTFVVKTRLTEDEHSFFMEQLKNYEMSQSEFIRQAIDGAVIKPIIRVNPVNDEVLAILGKLVAEYNKIGSNIKQMAKAKFLLDTGFGSQDELDTAVNTAQTNLQVNKKKPRVRRGGI